MKSIPWWFIPSISLVLALFARGVYLVNIRTSELVECVRTEERLRREVGLSTSEQERREIAVECQLARNGLAR